MDYLIKKIVGSENLIKKLKKKKLAENYEENGIKKVFVIKIKFVENVEEKLKMEILKKIKWKIEVGLKFCKKCKFKFFLGFMKDL